MSKVTTKLVKEQKLKVQAQIQGDAVRITGKSKDDLQTAIQILKAQSLEFPIQFTNFRVVVLFSENEMPKIYILVWRKEFIKAPIS